MVEVRRDMRHLLTPEAKAFLTENNGDDTDDSDEWRERDY